ncbi:hypothetical protein TD95_000132 [Thielaviopsis punctulata]|uniref:Uncharacterized protein n=1 Tax=Thielaviopsis punctulata TaxID=72032 RepID=A0A0F4Z7F8_9PEZI|nr:hypothetical protein TD95_000132 [Thielaviopsis punctulata]
MQNHVFQPIAADALLDAELQKRCTHQSKVQIGCPDIDQNVLLGGFERASVIGVSTEEESMSLQMAVQVVATQLAYDDAQTALIASTLPVATVARALKDTLLAQHGRAFAWRSVLERVSISRVFDVRGLEEALGEVERAEKSAAVCGGRPETPVEQARVAPDDVRESERELPALRRLSMEIPDSEEDDDGEFSQEDVYLLESDEESSELSEVPEMLPSQEEGGEQGGEKEQVKANYGEENVSTSSPLSSLSSLEELEDIEHLEPVEEEEENQESGSVDADALSDIVDSHSQAIFQPLADGLAANYPVSRAQSPLFQTDAESTLKPTIIMSHGNSPTAVQEDTQAVLGIGTGESFSVLETTSPEYSLETASKATMEMAVEAASEQQLEGPQIGQSRVEILRAASSEGKSSRKMSEMDAEQVESQKFELATRLHSSSTMQPQERMVELESSFIEPIFETAFEEPSLEEFAPIEPTPPQLPQPSQPSRTSPQSKRQETPQSKSQETPHSSPPTIIAITHFSTLLTTLFANSSSPAAHDALQLLSRRIRHLSRTLSSSPLILLTNGTTAPFLPASAPPPTLLSKPRKPQHEPTLKSVFSPLPNAPAPKKHKPAFGLSFTQMLDVHLLCTTQPRNNQDAERLALGQAARMVWVVEVLMDDVGVWDGRTGERSTREQRWGAFEIQGGRLVDVFPRP